MIDRTFQLIRGIGPGREKDLWRNGIRTWNDLSPNQINLSAKLDPALRAAINQARSALGTRDLATLMELLPARERWRLYPHFADEAAYLDIETEGTHATAEVTCIGVLWRGQVFAFVNGFNLEAFPAFAEQLQLLVTFNGSCFDVPVLERYFRHLKMPRAHIDARFVARSAGLTGGLKQLEDDLGLHRPLHLKGVSGFEAVLLWKAWRDTGSRAALLQLVEYNLYDAIQLKPVLERIFNRMRERALSGAEVLPETERGDVLYDVTRVVAQFAAPAIE
jgi:uncharacterized protein YprB with RNaseH-like and TPR domain